MQTASERRSVCARAHLGQSGLLVADLMFAYGCQLLQCVAVVGQCPRQSGKLGPSCRNKTVITPQHTVQRVDHGFMVIISPVDIVQGSSRDMQEVQIFPQLALGSRGMAGTAVGSYLQPT